MRIFGFYGICPSLMTRISRIISSYVEGILSLSRRIVRADWIIQMQVAPYPGLIPRTFGKKISIIRILFWIFRVFHKICFGRKPCFTFTIIFLFGFSECWSVGSVNFSFHPSPTKVTVKGTFALSRVGPSWLTIPSEKSLGYCIEQYTIHCIGDHQMERLNNYDSRTYSFQQITSTFKLSHYSKEKNTHHQQNTLNQSSNFQIGLDLNWSFLFLFIEIHLGSLRNGLVGTQKR